MINRNKKITKSTEIVNLGKKCHTLGAILEAQAIVQSFDEQYRFGADSQYLSNIFKPATDIGQYFGQFCKPRLGKNVINQNFDQDWPNIGPIKN